MNQHNSYSNSAQQLQPDHQSNTIYLVRHGENRANLTHEFSYKTVDYPLTPKGVLQAEQTAEYFQNIKVDEIYSSPLRRAHQTAEIIAQKHGLVVQVREQFREVNVGSLEGRAPIQENWDIHNRIVQDWFDGKKESAFPDGEDYFTLLQRMRNGLLDVTRGKHGKTIVIAGHGGIFTRTMPDICPTANIEELLRVQNYNCSITEIELVTEGDYVEGVLKMWAYYGHLHGEAANVVPGTSLSMRKATTQEV